MADRLSERCGNVGREITITRNLLDTSHRITVPAGIKISSEDKKTLAKAASILVNLRLSLDAYVDKRLVEVSKGNK